MDHASTMQATNTKCRVFTDAAWKVERQNTTGIGIFIQMLEEKQEVNISIHVSEEQNYRLFKRKLWHFR